MRAIRMMGVAGCLVLISGLAGTPSWGAGQSNRIQSGSDRPGELSAVAVVTANDIWAVGTRLKGDPYPSLQAGAQHWDGQRWRAVPVPHPGMSSQLNAVDGVSPTDVWAGGYSDSADYHAHTLLMHWDGTSWTKMSFPGSGVHDIQAISAVSSDDVWVAGTGFVPSLGFVGHWDGTAWTTQPLAIPDAEFSNLTGIDARSGADVWVVGEYETGPRSPAVPVTAHWDGQAWTLEPAPGPDQKLNLLRGIDTLPSGQAWTVGSYGGDRGGGGLIAQRKFRRFHTLADQWDGTRWTQSTTRNPLTDVTFSGVASVAEDDVWAVGGQEINLHENPLIEHWSGVSWSIVDNPPLQDGELLAIDATSSTDIWAVGFYDGNGFNEGVTLVLHWDGMTWTKV